MNENQVQVTGKVIVDVAALSPIAEYLKGSEVGQVLLEKLGPPRHILQDELEAFNKFVTDKAKKETEDKKEE